MELPKNLGSYLLSIWFILAGLASFISYGSLGMLLPILMIVTGVIFLIELMSLRPVHATNTQDVLVNNWSQLRGPILVWWNKLNDRDLDEINGNYGVLVSKLKSKYGLSDQFAREEIDQHLADYRRHGQTTVLGVSH